MPAFNVLKKAFNCGFCTFVSVYKIRNKYFPCAVQYFLKFPIGIILGNLEFNFEFYLQKTKRQCLTV